MWYLKYIDFVVIVFAAAAAAAFNHLSSYTTRIIRKIPQRTYTICMLHETYSMH